jgi:hypothetical protein
MNAMVPNEKFYQGLSAKAPLSPSLPSIPSSAPIILDIDLCEVGLLRMVNTNIIRPDPSKPLFF